MDRDKLMKEKFLKNLMMSQNLKIDYKAKFKTLHNKNLRI